MGRRFSECEWAKRGQNTPNALYLLGFLQLGGGGNNLLTGWGTEVINAELRITAGYGREL